MTRAHGVGTVVSALPGDDGLVWIAAKLGEEYWGVPMNAADLRDFGQVLVAHADAMDERDGLLNDTDPAGQGGARSRERRSLGDGSAELSASRKS